mgnify:CR=1 FL=1
MDQKSLDLKQALLKLEETLEIYFCKKIPFFIPDKFKELMVQFLPYLTILLIIVNIPLIFNVLTFSNFFLGRKIYSFNYILSIIFLTGALIFVILAIPGLFKRKERSWRFLFYASLLNFISGFLSGDWIGMIIVALFFWYVLFQIKNYYS